MKIEINLKGEIEDKNFLEIRKALDVLKKDLFIWHKTMINTEEVKQK